MKSIGWCLENILVSLQGSSMEIETPNGRKRAQWAIDKVEEYLKTLLQLIDRDDFRKTLFRLKNSPIKEVQLQEQEIEQLINDLRYTANHIGHSLKQSQYLLDNYARGEEFTKRWRQEYDKLAFFIAQKFGGERGEFRKEFEAVLHTEQELKKIVKDQKHLASMLR